jgi:hypothetical protein
MEYYTEFCLSIHFKRSRVLEIVIVIVTESDSIFQSVSDEKLFIQFFIIGCWRLSSKDIY